MSYSFQDRSKQMYLGLCILEDKMTEFMTDTKQHWSQKIKYSFSSTNTSSAEVMTKQGRESPAT
jgi:hypothetical protein